jgi:hypothetical protein
VPRQSFRDIVQRSFACGRIENQHGDGLRALGETHIKPVYDNTLA